MGIVSYANRLKTQLYWWLGRKRPFIINDEYMVELVFVDTVKHSAKIKVTNLKTDTVVEGTVDGEQQS